MFEDIESGRVNVVEEVPRLWTEFINSLCRASSSLELFPNFDTLDVIWLLVYNKKIFLWRKT